MPNQNEFTGLDTTDSAFADGKELVSAVGNGAVHGIADRIGLTKVLFYCKLGAILLLLVVVVIFLLFGAASYIAEGLSKAWPEIKHWKMGSIEDTYEASYYDQASAMLEAMEEGKVSIGNDMMMLSSEDMKQILSYVVSYNQNTSYATTPERIRYEYKSLHYEEDPVYDWVENTNYNFVTHSYSEYGNETDVRGENVFDVPWQTIMVLCEMMAEDNYNNFGSDQEAWKSSNYEDFLSDYSFQTSMNGYFVTDEQVNAICDMVDYHYNTVKVQNGMDYIELVKDAIENDRACYGGGNTADNLNGSNVPNADTWGISLSTDDMEKGTYRLYSSKQDKYIVQDAKIPAIAMKSITNFYQVVEYHYEKDGSNVRYFCSSRTSTIDSKRFMTMVQTLIPSFSFDHFFELLQLMPGSERELEKYEKIRQLYEKGEKLQQEYELNPAGITTEALEQAYQEQMKLSGDVFTGYGNYVGLGTSALSGITSNFTGAGSVWIGTHYITLGGSEKAMAYNDWFPVSSGAYANLNTSDRLSKEQISTILEYQVKQWFGKSNIETNRYWVSTQLVDTLYNMQEKQQISITGFLAIIRQEGTMRNGGFGVTKWNLINYKAQSGGFRDFKAEYPNSVEGFCQAVEKQILLISTYYLKKGQDSYFKMQFGKEFVGEVEGEYDESLIVHSFCPWWEDTSFPYQKNGLGWCNNNALFREELLGTVGLSAMTDMLWPCPSYTKITSFFGKRQNPFDTSTSENHGAIDIAAQTGSQVLASDGGTVTFASGYTPSQTAGYWIKIDHGNGFSTRYLHLNEKPLVNTGDYVKKGDLIGYVGNTGNSTGPHLHFEVIENGVNVDPLSYVTPPTNTLLPEGNGSLYEIRPEQVSIQMSGLSKNYKIAWISDLHLITDTEVTDLSQEGLYYYKNRYENEFIMRNSNNEVVHTDEMLNQIVSYLMSNQFDGIIFGGDLLDYCSKENVKVFKEALGKLQTKYRGKMIYLRADHDYDTSHASETFSQTEAYNLHKTFFDGDSLAKKTLDLGEMKIIGINASTKNISTEALQIFEQEYQKKEVPVIVATHVPIYSRIDGSLEALSKQYRGKIYYWHPSEGGYIPGKEMQELIGTIYAEESRVRAVVAGHMHTSWNGLLVNDKQEHIFGPAYEGTVGIMNIIAR